MEMPGLTYSASDYRYGFNGKEKDSAFGLLHYDYGFRIYHPGLGRFLSVDPLAGSYAGWSPFNYVMGNPIRLIDPDGRKVVNPYENYKQYAGIEEQLKNDIANASSSKEKAKAKKALRENMGNINGYNSYQEVQKLLSDFKQANESEYNHIDNLQFNGVEVDVIVGLSDDYKGEDGQLGDTNYSYDPKKVIYGKDFNTGDNYLLPTKMQDDKIRVTLYLNGRTLSTLANEFGDAIFGVENPRASLQDYLNKTPYWERSSVKFSFDYQDYITKGKDKPNPEDY